MRNRGWLLILSALGVVNCGGSDAASSDDPPVGGECATQSASWRTCSENVLFECPVGDGSMVDMVLIQDCGGEGLACDDFDEACVDPSGSILSAAAASFSAVGSTAGISEETSYTLDEAGLSIMGNWGDETAHSFVFETGEFDRINVQVFSDGVVQEQQTATVSVSLDTVEDDGLSTLFGQGYFKNASVTPGTAYVVNISSSEAGETFEVQLQGSAN